MSQSLSIQTCSSQPERKEEDFKEAKRKRKRIYLFGNFGLINFGNESTLQAFFTIFAAASRMPTSPASVLTPRRLRQPTTSQPFQ